METSQLNLDWVSFIKKCVLCNPLSDLIKYIETFHWNWQIKSKAWLPATSANNTWTWNHTGNHILITLTSKVTAGYLWVPVSSSSRLIHAPIGSAVCQRRDWTWWAGFEEYLCVIWPVDAVPFNRPRGIPHRHRGHGEERIHLTFCFIPAG